MATEDLEFLQSSVGRRDIELPYDEFDSHETYWIHRLLFWPYREVSVRFAIVELQVTPAQRRFDEGG